MDKRKREGKQRVWRLGGGYVVVTGDSKTLKRAQTTSPLEHYSSYTL